MANTEFGLFGERHPSFLRLASRYSETTKPLVIELAESSSQLETCKSEHYMMLEEGEDSNLNIEVQNENTCSKTGSGMRAETRFHPVSTRACQNQVSFTPNLEVPVEDRAPEVTSQVLVASAPKALEVRIPDIFNIKRELSKAEPNFPLSQKVKVEMEVDLAIQLSNGLTLYKPIGLILFAENASSRRGIRVLYIDSNVHWNGPMQLCLTHNFKYIFVNKKLYLFRKEGNL